MRMSPGGDAQTLLALMHARAEVARLGEREQLFSTLAGGVNAVLWAFDWQAQRMIYVSPAYERIFGRSPALLLADYGEWRNAIYPDDVEYARRACSPCSTRAPWTTASTASFAVTGSCAG